jgi:hypothetical protein
MFTVRSDITNNLIKEAVMRCMSETTSNMSHIGLTLLLNMANEAETSLDLRHQGAHVDDGIFTKLLEKHAASIRVSVNCRCNLLMNEEALSE